MVLLYEISLYNKIEDWESMTWNFLLHVYYAIVGK